jgi:hypothetical protein
MADKHTKRPHGNAPEHRAEHADLLPDRDPAAAADLDREGGPDAVEVALAMTDLVADDQGEIVLFNDSDLRRLVLTTDSAVVAEGCSGAHRTSAGEDVAGFSFVTFDNGVTLYYQPGLDLAVRAALD